MNRSATPKLGAYAGLAAVGLLAALATGLPELVALAAPFALLVTVGVLQVRRPVVDADVTLTRERVLEGDEVVATIALDAAVGADTAEVLLELPAELVVPGKENPHILHLADGGRSEPEIPLTCVR
jgi:uncharacterized protein (DUF58 family)